MSAILHIIAKFLVWIHHSQELEMTQAMNPKLEGIILICETPYWTETKQYFFFLNCGLTQKHLYENQ